ncbi:MAG: winged helix-turn-helix transcriptional regulator [Acidobacteria bacterium]|nr:winged helix-turn-helix transcriptional regulator [Acidobacteriota bacterium]
MTGWRSQSVVTQEIRTEVVRCLRRITRAIDLHSKHLLQQCSLTGPQVMIMAEIAAHKEITIGDLARKVSLSPATVTGVLNRLHERKFVVRTQDHEDRRRKLVALTPLGHEHLNAAPALLQDDFVKAFEGLKGWEQSQILTVLQRVASLMDAESLDAAPILTSGKIDLSEHEATQRALE